MPKKIINLFLFLLFFERTKGKKGGGGLAGSLAQASDLDTKGVQPSFVNGELLFKWINSLEQYRHIHYKEKDHANSANTRQKKACNRWIENQPGDEETAVALEEWWLLGLHLSFFLCSVFGSTYCLLLYSAPPSLSLLIPNFLFPFLQFLFAKNKWSKGVFLVFLLLSLSRSLFSPLFSYFSAIFLPPFMLSFFVRFSPSL